MGCHAVTKRHGDSLVIFDKESEKVKIGGIQQIRFKRSFESAMSRFSLTLSCIKFLV